MTGLAARALAFLRVPRPATPAPTPVGSAAIEADHANLRVSALAMAIGLAGTDWAEHAPMMAHFLIEGSPDGDA